MVFHEKEVQFMECDWGQTKVLVGNESPICKDNEIEVKITEYLPGYKHSWHSHPEKEIIFVLSGKGEAESDSTVKSLKPGDVVYIPSNAKHENRNPFSEPLRVVVIKLPAEK